MYCPFKNEVKTKRAVTGVVRGRSTEVVVSVAIHSSMGEMKAATCLRSS